MAFEHSKWCQEAQHAKYELVDEIEKYGTFIDLVDHSEVSTIVEQVFPAIAPISEVNYAFLAAMHQSYSDHFSNQELSWLASHSGATRDQDACLFAYGDLSIIAYPERTYLQLGELPDAYYFVTRLQGSKEFEIIDHEGTARFSLGRSYTQAILRLGELDLDNLNEIVTELT